MFHVHADGVAWRCPRKGCQKVVSIRNDTFFSNSNLPISKILRILHLWSTKTSLGDMLKEVDVSGVMHVKCKMSNIDTYVVFMLF